MAGLTINEERQEYVTFTDSYYQASQRLIVPSADTTFDECKTADEVAAKLGELSNSDKIGVQAGTTGQSGSLAVQDMLNGNIKYVIIDAAPAAAITASINAMQ